MSPAGSKGFWHDRSDRPTPPSDGTTVVLKLLVWVAVLTIAELSTGASVAQEQPRSNVGTLTCRVGPGIGAVVASRRRLACRFNARDGYSEQYAGSVTRFGLDIGITAGGVMGWNVLTRTRGVRRGALAGHYVGASGDVSLGLGGGAKVLVGGSRRATMLQPVSVVAQVGVNLALGVAGLELRFLSSSPAD
jgi:hypothetical protein